MSFRVSQPKYITAATVPNLIGTNVNIPGYYQVNGVPINNQFYPALNTDSFGKKAVSTWTGTGNGNSNRSVTWSPQLGIFALCSNTTNTTGVYTSTDGINWTGRTTPAYGPWDITWANYVNEVSGGIFVAISSFGSMISSNGIDWSGNTVLFANDWVGITWSPEKQLFVAVARGATINNNTVMISSNGSTWNAYTPPINASSVCWAKELGKFFAIGAGVMSSSDGINWNVTNTTINGTNIIWSSELGKFLSNGGTGNTLSISSDGISWTNITTPSPLTGSVFNALSYSPQLNMFLAITSGGTVGSMYSRDGINWKTASSTGFMRRAIWSPELGIFVSVVNTGVNRTQYSSLAGRPPTSFNVFDSSFNNINQLGLWNFQSFGRGRPVLKTGNFTVAPGENWIDVSNTTTTVVTLPSASLWSGEELMFKTLTAQPVISNTSNNVILLNGVDASNGIVPGTTGVSTVAGRWSTLVSNGTNWEVMQAS
jgi:hypothetical protein